MKLIILSLVLAFPFCGLAQAEPRTFHLNGHDYTLDFPKSFELLDSSTSNGVEFVKFAEKNGSQLSLTFSERNSDNVGVDPSWFSESEAEFSARITSENMQGSWRRRLSGGVDALGLCVKGYYDIQTLPENGGTRLVVDLTNPDTNGCKDDVLDALALDLARQIDLDHY